MFLVYVLIAADVANVDLSDNYIIERAKRCQSLCSQNRQHDNICKDTMLMPALSCVRLYRAYRRS